VKTNTNHLKTCALDQGTVIEIKIEYHVTNLVDKELTRDNINFNHKIT
jgi:hypothetical protein